MKKILPIFFMASFLSASNVTAAHLNPQKEPTSILELPIEKTTIPRTIIDSIKNGLYSENGQTRYYNHGNIHKGFLELNGDKYYFDENGNMKTGYRRIEDSCYYFDSRGVMQTGLVEVNAKKYYFDEKTGKKLFGHHKIGKHYYYFDEKSGEMITGFQNQQKKDSTIRTYYNEQGQLQTGEFQVSSVAYKASRKNGQIYSVKNLAGPICQRPELPTGCEITSWTMMANYAGLEINKIRAANIMPTSADPNQGFVGSPYSSSGGSLVVYPGGLMTITQEHLGGYIDMTKCSLEDIRNKLWEKHLVLIWVTRLDGFDSHTVALTGYDSEGFYYNDPWTGAESKLSNEELTEIWEGNGRRAMSY